MEINDSTPVSFEMQELTPAQVAFGDDLVGCRGCHGCSTGS